MADLYTRLDSWEDAAKLVAGTDEDVLVALAGRPALLRLPGADPARRARVVACLLHGNEDSGFRAVCDLLRDPPELACDLWVFIGNVRAASQEGWFAHRFLDDQEDFNRVWGLEPLTTRMRRCAAEVLAELRAGPLEAAIDLHNNTGDNPRYAVLPDTSEGTMGLAGVVADLGLLWGGPGHTLMAALDCPAVALEAGLPGVPEGHAWSAEQLRRFLAAPTFEVDGRVRGPNDLYEVRFTVNVRPEVPFAFGGPLTDDVDLVLRPGLDAHNFGMLLAGTVIGRVHPGTAMPLTATDRDGVDAAGRLFAIAPDGAVTVTEDVTPVMMVTTVLQTRRDCLCYLARRRPSLGLRPPQWPTGKMRDRA